MAVLSTKQRDKSAVVHTKSGDAKFPVPDKAHARAALARLNQAKPALTHEQKMAVIRRAHAVLSKGK